MTQRSLVQRVLVAFFAVLLTIGPAGAGNIIKVMSDDMGQRRPGGCPSRWCACYMDLALAEAGFKIRGSYRARDFATYGEAAKPLTVGSIMVMRNHVGVVTGTCQNGAVQLLSGNHSRKVSLGCYSAKKAIAWRKPVR